eukprot:6720882-Pyramimonas_sp.AAC.1
MTPPAEMMVPRAFCCVTSCALIASPSRRGFSPCWNAAVQSLAAARAVALIRSSASAVEL